MVFRGLETSIYLRIASQLPDLTTYALACCGNRTAAEDLVKECLLRAVNRDLRFRSDRHLRAWLFTILHNLCLRDPRFGRESPRPKLRADSDGFSPPALSAERMLLRVLSQRAALSPHRQRRSTGVDANSIDPARRTGRRFDGEARSEPRRPQIH